MPTWKRQGLRWDLNTLEQAARKCDLIRVVYKLETMINSHRGFTIDSGAAEHVIPLGWKNSILRKESEGSRRGVHYVAAPGARVPNVGEQRVPFWTTDGAGTSWLFQFAETNKPLVLVAELTVDGWKVAFNRDGSCLGRKRSGQLIARRREWGVFVVDADLETYPPTNEQLFQQAGTMSSIDSSNP